MVNAEKLRKAVADHVFDKDSAPLHVTVSIGVASLHNGETFDQAVKRVDVALYEAKRSGRNCAVLAAP